ncbi:MAG: amino acid adenylation domain-containing protein [Alphaproteobacteria bacterium]
MRRLHDLLRESARQFPERIAVEEPDGCSIRYAQLDSISDSIRDRLVDHGVAAGDRVGLYLEKSLASVAAIFGILKCGAAYVPVDPHAPVERNRYIFADCSVRVVVTDSARAEKLRAPDQEGLAFRDLICYTPEELNSPIVMMAGTVECTESPADEPLAYILYTSGSTGRPKGVMHSHRTALSFIDWCSEEFSPVPEDRFSSHAPFHFDLSIFDLFASIKHGAAVVLIGEELGKQPMRLAPVIAESRISVWYSTPSILRLLTEFGRLEKLDLSRLRLLLFAGEIFPMKHLAALHRLMPHPRYYNLYGPTETNVCTFFKADGKLIETRERPLPIGLVCSGDEALVVDVADKPVEEGQDGELLIRGGSVMLGYWNLKEQNERAFYIDAVGQAWYRTGDIVREQEKGVYIYLGRRDRMVKRRGFRVELGEIETALNNHPDVMEAAVIAKSDSDGQVSVEAFLAWSAASEPSILQLKKYCTGALPAYMAPDRFRFLPSLPKTSTDKVDYQKLKAFP